MVAAGVWGLTDSRGGKGRTEAKRIWQMRVIRGVSKGSAGMFDESESMDVIGGECV